MRKLGAVLVVLVAFTLFVLACARTPDAPHRLGATGATPQITDRLVYLSGTSGSVTIPAGDYVTSVWAHNTSGGGTLIISPSGPNAQTPCAADAGFDASGLDAGPDAGFDASAFCSAPGPTITIPAATAFTVGQPVLRGSWDELGPGSMLVFASTDAYVITMYHYGP